MRAWSSLCLENLDLSVASLSLSARSTDISAGYVSVLSALLQPTHLILDSWPTTSSFLTSSSSTITYSPGGFHPVHIGDNFCEGRYTVVPKLRHGTYSTVWLAKDSTTTRHVALKILAASASQWSRNSSYEDVKVLSLSRLRSSEGDE